jgi:hypothetical protein
MMAEDNINAEEGGKESGRKDNGNGVEEVSDVDDDDDDEEDEEEEEEEEQKGGEEAGNASEGMDQTETEPPAVKSQAQLFYEGGHRRVSTGAGRGGMIVLDESGLSLVNNVLLSNAFIERIGASPRRDKKMTYYIGSGLFVVGGSGADAMVVVKVRLLCVV